MNNIFQEKATIEKLLGGRVSGIMPNPETVLTRGGENRYSAYRRMLNDPHVWCCVQSRKSGVLNTDIDLKVNSSISSIWEKLDKRSLQDMILDSILFGYQPIELVWQKSEIGIVPVPKAKPPEWFSFSNNGQPVITYGQVQEGKVDPDRFVIPVYGGSYTNPYGTALLAKCYWPVTFKNGGLRFWATFTERYGMPLLIGQYERGSTSDEAQELATHLSGMTQDSVIVSPSDVKIEVVEPSRNSSTDLYLKMIENSNTEISKAILSQTLTTEIDSGSRAAAEIHYKIRQEVIESDIRYVKKWLTEIAYTIERVNREYG
jgi:phage gp29-like protein